MSLELLENVNFAPKKCPQIGGEGFFVQNQIYFEKWKNIHFYFLLNAFLIIQFWKNLRNRFCKLFIISFFHFWAQKSAILKACVRYFLSNLYFSQNDSTSKTMKNVYLFHLKSSFRSRDIQIIVFPFPPLFSPVSHCFGGWYKKNLKVYDDINCLNKKLTHFVWYLEKKLKLISSLFRTKYIEKKVNLQLLFLPIVSWTFTLTWPTTGSPPS